MNKLKRAAQDRAPKYAGVRRYVSASVLISCIVVSTVAILVGSESYFAAGVSDPGRAATLLYALLRLAAMTAGSLTLGSLFFAVFVTPPTSQWKVNTDGYAGLLVAERASAIWFIAAVALVPVSSADSAGITVGEAFRRGAVWTLVEATEKPKAWVVVAVLAAIMALGTRVALSWNSLLGLAGLSSIAVLPPALVGNAGEGPNHDLATGAVMVFTVAISLMTGLSWSTFAHVRRSGDHRSLILKRYWIAMTVAVVASALTAIVLGWILIPRSLIFTTLYGQLAVASAVILFLVGVSVQSFSRPKSPFLQSTEQISRILGMLFVSVISLSTILLAMSIQPAAAFGTRPFTATDILLGFDLPESPNMWRFLTLWRFDFVLGTASIVLVILYLWGYIRLRRRGDQWSSWRTVAWILGCVVLLLTTSSGFAAYGYGMFSVHMATHMAFNMFIPVLLVLGAPVTLALRAIPAVGRNKPPGMREWILTLMQSKFTRTLSSPGVAIGIFVASLYGLYFSSLFDQLVRFHWGHVLMNIHFLITGYLFYWAVIGIDPGSKKLPYLGRLGMLFAIMPFHAFFGIAVMSMNQIIGGEFYSQLYIELEWMTDPERDQWIGGAIAWGSSEIPILIVVGALLSQWSKQDRLTAKRTDRHNDEYDDSDFDAYNAMLKQLSQDRR